MASTDEHLTYELVKLTRSMYDVYGPGLGPALGVVYREGNGWKAVDIKTGKVEYGSGRWQAAMRLWPNDVLEAL